MQLAPLLLVPWSYTILSLSLIVTVPPTRADDWVGCVDKEFPSKKVRRGQKTTVCLGVGTDGDWAAGTNYVRHSFKPVADDFSRFTIPNSYKDLVQSKLSSGDVVDPITIFASSQTSISFLRRYYDQEGKRIFPHLTAIIDVKDGIVSGIAWDKACVFCADSLCAANTLDFTGASRTSAQIKEPTTGCYLTEQECRGIVAEGGTECDLTLYVVWTGTDEKGKVLSSSKFRFSAFTEKQVTDRWQDGLDLIGDVSWPWE